MTAWAMKTHFEAEETKTPKGYRIALGYGMCASSNGTVVHARRFQEGNCSAARSQCDEDLACVAYACMATGNMSMIYSTTGCTEHCNVTDWMSDPTRITQAVFPQAQWETANCYVSNSVVPNIIKVGDDTSCSLDDEIVQAQLAGSTITNDVEVCRSWCEIKSHCTFFSILNGENGLTFHCRLCKAYDRPINETHAWSNYSTYRFLYRQVAAPFNVTPHLVMSHPPSSSASSNLLSDCTDGFAGSATKLQTTAQNETLHNDKTYTEDDCKDKCDEVMCVAWFVTHPEAYCYTATSFLRTASSPPAGWKYFFRCAVTNCPFTQSPTMLDDPPSGSPWVLLPADDEPHCRAQCAIDPNCQAYKTMEDNGCDRVNGSCKDYECYLTPDFIVSNKSWETDSTIETGGYKACS